MKIETLSTIKKPRHNS